MGGGEDSYPSVLQAPTGLKCDCSRLELALIPINICMDHNVQCNKDFREIQLWTQTLI